MIDKWYIETEFHRFLDAVPKEGWNDAVKNAEDRMWDAIGSLECEEDHCDDAHGDLIEPGPIDRLVARKLARIRLGVYSEERDGSVQEILEEIERILR